MSSESVTDSCCLNIMFPNINGFFQYLAALLRLHTDLSQKHLTRMIYGLLKKVNNNNSMVTTRNSWLDDHRLISLKVVWVSPEVPIGDVAGVPLWTLSPSDWEAAGGRGWLAAPEGPGRGPGGVSLCGDVRGVLRGVLGCDVCPPASRASRLLRILNKYSSRFTHSPPTTVMHVYDELQQSYWNYTEHWIIGFLVKQTYHRLSDKQVSEMGTTWFAWSSKCWS